MKRRCENILDKRISKEVINSGRKIGMYEKYFKHLLDWGLSFVTVLILSPVLLIIALLVKVKLGTPIIFKQERPGLNEKIFYMYKFRTMTNEKDEEGKLLPDEKRLTKFGKFLRSTSLDELPELFCILKGEMSIIGPRPLMPSYLKWYSENEKHRHDVRPGLTGLAQVNGRSFISWEEIFEYDLKYVNNITFLGDIHIFLKTIKKVFVRENIADLSEAKLGKDGHYHFCVDGKDVTLHEPLDIERKAKSCAERNR